MTNYFTIAKESEFSLTEKKSEFIGVCAPVESEAEALAFIEKIKKRHSTARHNVYAYVLRDGFITRYSDDGEPHGTAGVPVLDAIKKANLTNTAVVVTRYFGGILLGTGGLLRAYTAAAVGALKSAGTREIAAFDLLSLTLTYPDYKKIMSSIASVNAKTEKSDFSDNVLLTLAVREDMTERFIKDVSEATGGRIVPEKVGTKCDFV